MITVQRESVGIAEQWRLAYDHESHSFRLQSYRKWVQQSDYTIDAWDGDSLCGPPRVPGFVLEEARRQFIETLKVEG